MLYLTGSIILTSYLTLCFKVLERYGISAFQAIVFNYLTCVITGSFVNGAFPVNNPTVQEPWFPWACVMGVSFVAVFNLIAVTTQQISVAVTSVANKLSLVIPAALSVYLYGERMGAWKATGILLALAAVILTCYVGKSSAAGKKGSSGYLVVLLPLLLFLSSGLLDALINHVQLKYLTEENKNAYLISGFFAAATVGSLVLTAQYMSGRQRFALKHVLAGVLIGIPNYFSIWCLVQFLKASPWQSSASIPVNNMGIVLFSTVMAWLLFKEKLSKINWLGIALSLLAIYLIAFGDTL